MTVIMVIMMQKKIFLILPKPEKERTKAYVTIKHTEGEGKKILVKDQKINKKMKKLFNEVFIRIEVFLLFNNVKKLMKIMFVE